MIAALSKTKVIGLEIENSFSTITGCNDTELIGRISHECSFFVQGAFFSDLYNKWYTDPITDERRRVWDGRKRLFSTATMKFPTGLASKVIKTAKENGYKVKIKDFRIKPKKKFRLDFKYPHKLRVYQKEVVKNSVECQRGILKVATGGGKTLIALKIAHELGVKTLICVNTKEVLYDIYDTAKLCFPDEEIGIWGDGKKKLGKFITVATMSSVATKFKKKDSMFEDEDYKAILVDEVHHVGSTTWYLAVTKINAFYKYGLTGTAFRGDGSSIYLAAATGKKLADISARWLIDRGYLVEPTIYFLHPRLDDFDNPMPYIDVYKGGIVRNENRNNMIAGLVKKHLEKSKLVIFERLEHGDILYEKIKKIDPNCVIITGKTKDRLKLKKDFVDGKIKTAIVSRIYNEGADLPRLEVLINGAGGRSGIQVLQRIGRAVRTSEETGKTKAIIYDFYDGFNYKLEQHSIKRRSWVKREKFKIREVDEVATKDLFV